MSKIFEEALADAKKLKAVAEENAQKAILESVTPQIKQFMQHKLKLYQIYFLEKKQRIIIV